MDKNLAIRKFVAKMATDKELREKFQKITEEGSIEKAYEFAIANSDEKFSKKEFEAYFLSLSDEVKEEERKALEESSLDAVAGGALSDGHLSENKEFWEAQESNPNKGELLASIFNNEEELLKTKNKKTYATAALGASKSFVNFIKTCGDLFLSKKDREMSDLEYKDKADEREIAKLNNLLLLKQYENQLDAKGIKH